MQDPNRFRRPRKLKSRKFKAKKRQQARKRTTATDRRVMQIAQHAQRPLHRPWQDKPTIAKSATIATRNPASGNATKPSRPTTVPTAKPASAVQPTTVPTAKPASAVRPITVPTAKPASAVQPITVPIASQPGQCSRLRSHRPIQQHPALGHLSGHTLNQLARIGRRRCRPS